MWLENNEQSDGSIHPSDTSSIHHKGPPLKGHMKEFGLPINGNPSKVDLPHIHF